MITVARLGSLKSLNFSNITAADRANAEMFYLSRIGRQLAAAARGRRCREARHGPHRRYGELCELYGEPAVVRKTEINPTFLDARLVSVQFRLSGGNGKEAAARPAMVPKSFDIYAVKAVVGKLFGLPPLKLRLVWETGEWDPVADFGSSGKDVGDSSDEEDEEEARRRSRSGATLERRRKRKASPLTVEPQGG